MIAYYVHHHGSGHVNRALAIAGRLRTPVVGLSTLAEPAGWPGRWVRLPDDAEGAVSDVTAHGTLHWAPLRHKGFHDRMAMISASLADARVLVSDVSVEVALLARLHGVPVAIVAQPGDRTDRPHRIAYDAADRLLAPWPRRRAAGWPAAWSAKTVHMGSLSRFDSRSPLPATAHRDVLVLWGTGGVDVPAPAVRAAAAATPDWNWTIAGPLAVDPLPNLTAMGWVPDPWPLLGAARVVVTHAGQNAVAEVAAARRAAVVIPQARPFDEQHATAAALAAAGIARVSPHWPEPSAWPDVLREADALGPGGWSRWSTGGGAEHAAHVLDAMAGA